MIKKFNYFMIIQDTLAVSQSETEQQIRGRGDLHHLDADKQEELDWLMSEGEIGQHALFGQCAAVRVK